MVRCRLYKSKNARRGVRALRRYHKSMRRKKWVNSHPSAAAWALGISSLLASIAISTTDRILEKG